MLMMYLIYPDMRENNQNRLEQGNPKSEKKNISNYKHNDQKKTLKCHIRYRGGATLSARSPERQESIPRFYICLPTDVVFAKERHVPVKLWNIHRHGLHVINRLLR